MDSEVIDQNSSSGSEAKKRYQSLKDEGNESEDPLPQNQRPSQGVGGQGSGGQAPVQIKQVS